MIDLTIELAYVSQAEPCDRSLLREIELVDEEEKESFSKEDWCRYARGWYDSWALPEIGPARYFYGVDRPVIPLAGKRFRVWVEYDDWDDPGSPDGKRLRLEETLDPETVPNRESPPRARRGGHSLHVFGQPHWIQGESFPAGPDGRPCYNLITVENGWGDSGNWNVLVDLGDDGLPTVAYFEASCCWGDRCDSEPGPQIVRGRAR